MRKFFCIRKERLERVSNGKFRVTHVRFPFPHDRDHSADDVALFPIVAVGLRVFCSVTFNWSSLKGHVSDTRSLGAFTRGRPKITAVPVAKT